MRVHRAYITSLWTTCILVGSAILLLAVTSAIVAFDGWPGDAASAPVDRVTVAPPALRAQPVSADAGTAAGGAAGATPVAVRVGSAPVSGRGPGGGGPGSTPGETPSGPGQTSTPVAGAPPAGGTSASQGQAPSSGPGGSPRPGDPIRNTGQRLDGTLAPISPQAGQSVAQLSDTLADAVDAVAAPPSLGGGF
jgi:hypothetical protein